MVTRNYTDQKIPGGTLITWTGLLNGDDGVPVSIPTLVEKTVQLAGALGTGGIGRIEGTLDSGGSPDWGFLKDADGADIQLNVIGMVRMVRETPFKIRPRVSAGDAGTNLTIRLLLTRIR